MNTECTPKQLILQGLGKRKIVISNDADVSTSDSGLILLQQMENKYQIIQKLSDCFKDRRDPNKIDHTLSQLLTMIAFHMPSHRSPRSGLERRLR